MNPLATLFHLMECPCFYDLQEGSQMGVAVTSLLLLELKPSTAAQAVPPASSAPAVRSSLHLACAMGCLMLCPLAEAGCLKTFAITGTLIYSWGRLLGTSWSSPKISMVPGGIKNLVLWEALRTAALSITCNLHHIPKQRGRTGKRRCEKTSSVTLWPFFLKIVWVQMLIAGVPPWKKSLFAL